MVGGWERSNHRYHHDDENLFDLKAGACDGGPDVMRRL